MREAALDRVTTALRARGGRRFWLCPQALLSGATGEAAIADGQALPLAGGVMGLAFSQVEIIARDATAATGMTGAVVSLDQTRRWAATSGLATRHESQLDALTAPR